MDPRRPPQHAQQPYQQQHHHHQQHHQRLQTQQPSNPRFSWQIPLSEAERLPIHQIDPVRTPPPQPQPQQPQQPHQHSSAPRPASSNNAPPQNARFSYVQTPIDYRQPNYQQQYQQYQQYGAPRRQTEPAIVPPRSPPHSPTSPAQLNSPLTEFGDLSAISTVAPQLPVPHLSRPLSKEIGQDISISPGGASAGGRLPEEYDRTPPQEPHPAFFAPVVDPNTSPRGSVVAVARSRQQSVVSDGQNSQHPLQQQNQQSHQQQQHYDHPPNSPGPIPIKTENDDDQKKQHHQQPTSPTSPTTPYSPHSNVAPPRPIFSPDNPTGPNGMLTGEHKPGQIAHPNMDLSHAPGTKRDWQHGLCDCGADCGTCLTGVFCPCVLYGKTGYRLGLKSDKKDPTDLLGWSWANTQCGIMAVAVGCGLCGIFPLIQRTRIRHAYRLEGSLPGDIIRSCCCCCCSAIQNEREVRDREDKANRWAGPSSGTAYQRPSPMVYEPPPRV